MTPRIGSLTIGGFRVFRELKLQGLGRVNLITGRNNTGKSSVLEALRILADPSPSILYDILRDREEVSDTDDSTTPPTPEALFQVATLFHGFPQFSKTTRDIVISANGGERSPSVRLSFGWLVEEEDSAGDRRLVPVLGEEGEDEQERIPALIVEFGGTTRALRLDYFRLRRYGRRSLGDEPRLPCEYVSPYVGERTAPLGVLWDKIALSDREKDVVSALQIIAPDISAVSMVGGEGLRRMTRTAIVRASSLPRPVPLRSFGDGLNRLFGIVLHLVNAKDGLLLIDEFENGMHHTVQLDAWRAVFKLSRQLDIQVFATSHSWDSIEAFQKAAADSPEDGVLIRLARKGEEIIQTSFSEHELAVATQERIEVR